MTQGFENAPDFENWLEAQGRVCAAKLAGAASATSLVWDRPGFGFGRVVRPAKGSVLASPEIDPTPGTPDNYFFHWPRDAAAVMDAALIFIRRDVDRDAWVQRFQEFVRFSLVLGLIDGERFLARAGDFRARVSPELLKYVRSNEEIAAVKGDAALSEARYSPDGEVDFTNWSRPQHDGPALTALTAMRFWRLNLSTCEETRGELALLIRRDLEYTLRHAGEPCYDIWEEEFARHYYTTLAQYAALKNGVHWAEDVNEDQLAQRLRAGASELCKKLDQFWSADRGYYRSRIMPVGQTTAKELDFSVILGALHAGLDSGPHSVVDTRVHATLRHLDALFAREYAINRDASAGLAYGRYLGDAYYSGGAWYFCTFAAAEFYYRLHWVSETAADGSALAAGDAIMSHVRRFIPDSGELSEQYDQTTGQQTSAHNLTWSYAAFLTALDARRRALTPSVA
jgi:glucoamylase